MTYNKPEIALLGDATCVINGNKFPVTPFDSDTDQRSMVSAYELDE